MRAMCPGSRMLHRARSALVAATVCSFLAGCTVSGLPDTANYTGASPAFASVAFRAALLPERPEIQAVELAVSDLMLHRVADDTWVVFSGAPQRIVLTDVLRGPAFADVPITAGDYDQLIFGIAGARVATDDIWRVAEVATDDIEFVAELAIEGDTLISLVFSLAEDLAGDAEQGWSLTPDAELSITRQGS